MRQSTPPAEDPKAESAAEDQDAASFLAGIPAEHRDAVAVADQSTAFGSEDARRAAAEQLVATREANKVAREQKAADLEAAMAAAPKADQITYALPPADYRAQQIVAIRQAAAEANLDTTDPGGRYQMADGSIRNANGDLLGRVEEKE